MKWPEHINQVIAGDCLQSLRQIPDKSIQCVVTSPPYFGLRDYGVAGQLGLEDSIAEYTQKMVEVFEEVRRVLRDDGTLWLIIGDSYNAYNGNRGEATGFNRNHHEVMPQYQTGRGLTEKALKNKDLIGVPWRVAFALQDAGWFLRQDNIWDKLNPMPESVKDRCTKAHEYIFMLTKSDRYFFDIEAIKEPVSGTAHARGNGVNPKASLCEESPDVPRGAKPKQNESYSGAIAGLVETRNKRSVWHVQTYAYPEAHFATFPPALILPCIKAGTSEEGACAECGAPMHRLTSRIETGYDGSKYGERAQEATGLKAHGGTAKSTLGSPNGRSVAKTITIGWRRDCKHNAKTRPCVVLDPFGGSGTTGMVAASHGRDYVLLELNPEYCDMARRRIDKETMGGRLR